MMQPGISETRGEEKNEWMKLHLREDSKLRIDL